MGPHTRRIDRIAPSGWGSAAYHALDACLSVGLPTSTARSPTSRDNAAPTPPSVPRRLLFQQPGPFCPSQPLAVVPVGTIPLWPTPHGRLPPDQSHSSRPHRAAPPHPGNTPHPAGPRPANRPRKKMDVAPRLPRERLPVGAARTRSPGQSHQRTPGRTRTPRIARSSLAPSATRPTLLHPADSIHGVHPASRGRPHPRSIP